MPIRTALALALGLAAAAPGAVAAQETHTGHAGHMAAAPATVPTEPGQGAFAAIAEIVAILIDDPATDWSRVDIEALRQHLIDMSNVTLEAEVRAEPIPGGARFVAGGSPDVLASLRRMVPAHATVMGGVRGWQLEAGTGDGVVTLQVTGPDSDVAMIRALGFIGVMAMGAHHQPHHLMIARGMAPH